MPERFGFSLLDERHGQILDSLFIQGFDGVDEVFSVSSARFEDRKRENPLN